MSFYFPTKYCAQLKLAMGFSDQWRAWFTLNVPLTGKEVSNAHAETPGNRHHRRFEIRHGAFEAVRRALRQLVPIHALQKLVDERNQSLQTFDVSQFTFIFQKLHDRAYRNQEEHEEWPENVQHQSDGESNKPPGDVNDQECYENRVKVSRKLNIQYEVGQRLANVERPLTSIDLSHKNERLFNQKLS